MRILRKANLAPYASKFTRAILSELINFVRIRSIRSNIRFFLNPRLSISERLSI